MDVRQAVLGGLMASALLAGCQSTTSGVPQGDGGNPTEPGFPTSRPSRTSTTTASSTPPPSPSMPATAAPATPAEALAPQDGYVFITTKSGQTRCQISTSEVDCEAPFTKAPVVDGAPANGVRVTTGGQLQWVLGNLGDIPVVAIDYRTYSALQWTIIATQDGTRFTNDGTGHGMFVAIEGVEAF